MKIMLSLLAAAGLATAVSAGEAAQPKLVEVACASHKVALDEAHRGAVARITTAGGVEFASGKTVNLFSVIVRRADKFADVVTVVPGQAKDFLCERVADGVQLTYRDFGDKPVEKVVCVVRGTPGDMRIRWRIAAVPKDGWAVCQMRYPDLSLTRQIGETDDDDAILTGAAFSAGLRRRPARDGFSVDSRQPGALAVQMACYYDPKALLLFACEDGNGEAKRLHGWWDRHGETTIRLSWTRYGWSTKGEALPYNVVTAAIDAGSAGREKGEELTWHDGADLYREWAEKQRWCRTPWKFRKDIPAWLRGKPAYGDMGSAWRGWMDRRGSLERWARDYFHKTYPDATVAVHFDGWEKDGVYMMTEYFPLYPDDATYKRYAEESLRNGVIVFPWPSGYKRADAAGKRPDGTFVTDEREAFNRVFPPHACLTPEGKMHDARSPWVGGFVTYMCGGDPWTLDWFSNDICGGLAKRGTPAVSCDQNIGGAFPDCWNPRHPHPPGAGRWMTDAIRKQSARALAVLGAHFKEASFCYEEPNEQVLDTVTFHNVREAYDPKVEWAGLFNYLYHEYTPIFPLGGKNLYGNAYVLANGMMPRITGAFGDMDHDMPILPNGGFETLNPDGTCAGWENGLRQLPNGPDTKEFHSGKISMRVEHPDNTNRWTHVAVSPKGFEAAFVPGRKYRFGAWMKAGTGSFQANLGIFGLKAALAWAPALVSGKPGDGWQYRESVFTYPTGDVAMVRIMLNTTRGGKGWIDDMTLDELLPDGKAVTLCHRRDAAKDAWQRQWLDIYGDKGREWLAYGRRVKPPRLECAKIEYGARQVDAVACGAYVSQDGRKAWVVANGATTPQKVSWQEGGRRYEVELAVREAKLVMK